MFCKVILLAMLSDRMFDDKGIGKPTCNDKAVVDYIIWAGSVLRNVTGFCSDNFDPLYFDVYSPVSFTSGYTALQSQKAV